jgi:hypothetical protein
VSAIGTNVVYYGDIVYLGNGLFSVSYIPLLAGQYSLSVKMGDWDIYCGLGEQKKCSPFSLVVEPGRTVSMTSEVESPYNQTMDFLVEAVAGEPSYFYIQAKDTYGNNRNSGGDPFRVKFIMKTNDAIQYKGNVVDNGDGTYTVHYSLPDAGIYDVAVTLQAEEFVDESLLTCTAAAAPFVFSRRYNGVSPYVAPAFCSLTHPTLTVVHAVQYTPMSTYDDGPVQTLAFAVTGVENTFHIMSRDFFGNLRAGDNTTHFAGYGNGVSDYFTVEFTKPELGYSHTVTSAVDEIVATTSAQGFFRLSFGGRTTQDIASDVTAEGLEALLEALHDFSLQVSVTKSTTSAPVTTKWSVQFQSMLDVWQSMPAVGPTPTGAQLSLVAPTTGSTSFYSSLSMSRPASRGVYPVSFTLWMTGSYTVNVRSGGVDIQGSPLTMFVSNAPVDPTASIAYGSGLGAGIAGAPSTFLVQARDTRQTEVQYIALRGLYPVTGSFSLAFKGETTLPIAYNASAAQVRAALMALYSIGDVHVTVDAFAVPTTGAVEGTTQYISSVWAVHFNGTCGGNIGGVASNRCPASLGDEPLLVPHTELLLYNATPPNAHTVPPEIVVSSTVTGYGGNNLSTSLDLSAVSFSLSHRSTSAKISTHAIQRLSCAGSNGTFTFQLLGHLFTVEATASVVLLGTLINGSPQATMGLYAASVSGSNALVCTAAGTTTDIHFTIPSGPMPLLDIVAAVNVTVAIQPVIEAADSIVVASTGTGLYQVTYTPTVEGTG